MQDPVQRLASLRTWLTEEVGLDGFRLETASADASFRRYFRIFAGADRYVAMDAPPEKEHPEAFVDIARRLHALDLSAPRILAAAPERGFLLLEDLGETTYTRALEKGADEAGLYRLAVDTLVTLHERWNETLETGLAPYSDEALLNELRLLTDWYWPAVMGAPCPDAVRESFLEAWRSVLPAAHTLPPTLVLRDYHVDNLMVLEGRPGVAACGLLDFQDALLGSPAYDLVSLLRDARRDIDPDLQAAMRARYLAAFPGLDVERFDAAYWVLGAQRNCKIIGIFTRLDRRDGKPAYLRHLPRLWRLLEEELARPALAPVRAWFDTYLPRELRQTPVAGSAA